MIRSYNKLSLTTPSTHTRSDISDMINALTEMNKEWEEQLQIKERLKATAEKPTLSIIEKEEALIRKALTINTIIIEQGYQSLALDRYEQFWKLAESTSSIFDKLFRGIKTLTELLDNQDLVT